MTSLKRVCLALALLAGVSIITVLAHGFPNLFLEDDAYFYLQIAWNIGSGRGATFDGLHATNGFHLLWTGVLAVLAAAVSSIVDSKVVFMWLAIAVSTGLAVGATLAAFKQTISRVLALLLFVLCGLTMETTLLAGLLLVLVMAARGDVAVNRPWIAVVAALIPLSRIDFAWMAPALTIAPAVLAGRAAAPRTRPLVLPVLVGTILGAAMHFGVHLALFDVWVSVSSAYKADIMQRYGVWQVLARNLSGSGNQLRYFALAVLVAVALREAMRTRRRAEIACVAITIAPILLYSLVNFMRDWYFMCSLLLALYFAERLSEDRPRLFKAAAGTLVGIVGLSCFSYLALNATDMRATRQWIVAANRTLKKDDVVFQVNGSGFTGWWLDAHVVNGDGLVNSWAYRERTLNQGLAGYLAEIGASYVVTIPDRRDELLVDRAGLVVRREDVRPVLEMPPTRTRLARFRLFALSP